MKNLLSLSLFCFLPFLLQAQELVFEGISPYGSLNISKALPASDFEGISPEGSLNILKPQAKLVFVKSDTKGKAVVPDGAFTLVLTFANSGNLKQAASKVKISFPPQVKNFGSNEMVLNALETGEKQEIEFLLYLDPSFTASNLKINFTASTDQGNVLSDAVNLPVGKSGLQTDNGTKTIAPVIILTRPVVDSKGPQKTLDVEFEGVINHNKAIKEFTIAGQTVAVDAELKFRTNIHLNKGLQKVLLLAKDIDGTIGQKEISLLIDGERVDLTKVYEGDKPSLFVLSVGIANYQNTEINVAKYADEDARSIDALFKNQKELFANVNTQLLINENATETNIRDQLTWLKKSPKANDVVVLYFSSHGQTVDGNYYILPYNVNLAKIEATSFDFSTIKDLVAKFHERKCKFILITDACYSAAGQNQLLVSKAGVQGNDLKTAIEDLKKSGSGFVSIASSASDETSNWSDKLKHGVLTYTILEALQKGMADKVNSTNPKYVIYFREELMPYIERRVKELNPKQNVIPGDDGQLKDFPISIYGE